MLKSSDINSLQEALKNTQFKSKDDTFTTSEYRDNFNADRLFKFNQ